MISMIAAMARNRVIGSQGHLPWNLPEDLKFFRDKTKGHIIIMGRKTFESFPQPLPNRLHIVITRDPGYQVPSGVFLCKNPTEAIDLAKLELNKGTWPSEIFVIGGGEIYRQMLPIADRIYLTEIRADFPGDAKFPEFSGFREVERAKRVGPPEFDFVVYDRVN